MPADIEQRILAYCLERPTHGAERVANELRLQGVSVSSGGVPRGVATPRSGNALQAPHASGERSA